MPCSSSSLLALLSRCWLTLLLLRPGLCRFPHPFLCKPCAGLGHPAGRCPPWSWRLGGLFLIKKVPGLSEGPQGVSPETPGTGRDPPTFPSPTPYL